MSNPANSEIAIDLEQVRKVYRLYKRPAYRVLDLLGMCAGGRGYYTEHAALNGVTLTINRGEKVAIIGRNGAGKSTLLKVITKTIHPTSGKAVLHGKVSALLQIGTGFHPDFTGRQNAYSAMALQGITGRTAHEKFEEIVDFAELEEYIDQPMKTYSTGMCARLMFSTSIVVTPDVLVVDEVLGVGDAYFTHKSFERMRQLCTGHGTTLLLVTHDIYSAMNLCDRFIWIDRGQTKLDADAKTTTAAYELSVKEQEEDRLRRRNAVALAKGSAQDTRAIYVRVANRSGFALPAPLAMARIELRDEKDKKFSIDLAAGANGWSLLPEGNLGPAAQVDQRPCRVLQPFGSIYHKAEWAVAVPKDFVPTHLSLDCNYEGTDEVEIRVAAEDQQVILRGFFGAGAGWRTVDIKKGEESGIVGESSTGMQYGNGLIRILDFRFTDPDGHPLVRVPHGAPLRAEIHIRVNGELPSRRPTFVMAFHKPGVAYSGYTFTDRLQLPEGNEFILTVAMDSILLGSGQWLVTIALAEEDFYNSPASKLYFTVNDKWYHLIARAFELWVEHSVSLDGYAFYVQPATFHVQPVQSDAHEKAVPTNLSVPANL